MKTLVVGVTPHGDRYANLAVRRLVDQGHDVLALGLRPGESNGVVIQTGMPDFQGVHTIALYLNPTRQEPMIDYFLSLKPARIIFNPGTENPPFIERAQQVGIETVLGCTLVMLATGQYE